MKTNFETKLDEYGEVIACDSCASEVPVAPFEWGPPYNEDHERKKRMLCYICANTYIGNNTRDYRNPEGPISRIIAQVGNILLYGVKE